MKDTLFFVSGITGHVGGATARQLLSQGYRVRTLSRDPQKAASWAEQGVEVRQGDLSDAQAVAQALEGVEGAFLMIPPNQLPSPDFSEAKTVISSYQTALAQTKPPRLVLLSSFGSEKSSGLGNIHTTHLMEEALGNLPFPTAFVRAGGFVENYVGSLQMAKATGYFDTFMQPTDRPFPTVVTADIGQEIARLLVSGWEGKKIVEMGSLITPDELAQAMGEALGQPVQARPIPREQWSDVLEQFGMPAGRTGMYEEMMDGCNSGWISFGQPGTEAVPSTTPPAAVFAQALKAQSGN